jgi:general secretion pathway protein N
MKHWILVAIGLVVYALTVMTTAPATLIDAGLQRISHGKMHLVETQGTLWSGSGQIEIRDSGRRTGVAKNVVWHILPETLLRGHLVCEVLPELATKPFSVTISLSRIELANVDLSLPATAMEFGEPRLESLGLTGEILLHITNLSIDHKQVQGNATLQWRDAGSVLTPISPLGDYELNLDGETDMVHVMLRTIHGPLQLEGKGFWANGDHPDFMAIAHVPPQHQQQLGPLLRLIAVERSAGNFELHLK